MTGRRLIVLVILALLAIVGAVWLSSERDLRRGESAGSPVFPTLSGALNDITEVRLVKAGGQTAVTLKRGEKHWQVVERSLYPADGGKLRKLLIDLAELRILEQKTSNPENYAVLGVEDVSAPTATGVRLELSGAPQPIALIVGKSAGGRSSYARAGESAASIVVTPALTLDTEPKNWLDRVVVDIAANRVQQASISGGKGAAYIALRESRERTDLTVRDLPKGRELASPTAANPIASAFSGLSFEDVRAVPADEQWGTDAAQAEYRLFDGTILEITGRKDGEQHWIRLTARFDDAQQQRFVVAPAAETQTPTAPASPPVSEPKPEEARSQAQVLAARFAGWAYEIPAYQYDALFRPLDELLKST